jgi:hypothetical protein
MSLRDLLVSDLHMATKLRAKYNNPKIREQKCLKR